MLQPTLEMYVLWHPADDTEGRLLQTLVGHFHGNLYAGLLGNVIEVFARSQPWAVAGGPPRPIPLPTSDAAADATALEAVDLTAVVVLAGTAMERADEADVGGWSGYLATLCRACSPASRCAAR